MFYWILINGFQSSGCNSWTIPKEWSYTNLNLFTTIASFVFSKFLIIIKHLFSFIFIFSSSIHHLLCVSRYTIIPMSFSQYAIARHVNKIISFDLIKITFATLPTWLSIGFFYCERGSGAEHKKQCRKKYSQR